MYTDRTMTGMMWYLLLLAECVLSVKKRVDFVQDKHGKTAAMWAAERGDADMFALMDKGCDLSVKDEPNSILHFACIGGNADILAYVVSQVKISINDRNISQETPVMCAALKGHKAVFDQLVNKGCDLTVEGWDGDNILHKACDGGNVQIVEYIVFHNIIDINSAGLARKTPVMCAALKGDTTVFDLLVSKECDLTVKDRDGDNILHAACEGGNLQIVEYIVSHNIVDINSTGDGGRTPVMMAALKGHKAVFDLLVSKGCDLTVEDKYGTNILRAARDGGNMQIVESLITSF